MHDLDICDDCGGLESRSDYFCPPPLRRPCRDEPFVGLVTMGVIIKPLRCAHCEWDDRLLAGTPARQGLDSLRRLHQKGLIDREEFLARERAMLLEFLGIDSLEAVPAAVTSEVVTHIASLRAGEPDTRGAADALPDHGSVHGVVTPQQVIAGYDADTGLVTFPVDLRRVIDLFGADAPGPCTAMWIRLVKLDEAAERGLSLAEMISKLVRDHPLDTDSTDWEPDDVW